MKYLYHKLFIIALFFSISHLTFSQTDTLIKFNDLKFHSDFEKEVFLDYQKNQVFNYFDLFLAIDQKVTAESAKAFRQEFDKKLYSIKNKDSRKNKPKKQVKNIYNAIHHQLDKYEELALFTDIFETQTYQCVTSSMLYSLFFDELEIPYSIEFVPGHVYLIAFPETEQIQIQTTDPLRGVFIYNHQFKVRFVNHLRDAKMISSEEYRDKSIDELFQKYFLKSESIDKTQLAGSLYNNLGVQYLEKSEFDKAYRAYQKSYYLFPSEQTKFFMHISLAALMELTSVSENIFAELLSSYVKLSQNHLNEDLISGLFINLTYKQLHTNGNIEQYKTSYNTIISATSDTSLKDELSFTYHYEMGSVMAKRKLYSKAQYHFKEALKIKENNYDVQNLLIGVIINEMNIYRKETEKIIEFQSRIMNIIDSVPSIQKNNNISDLRFEITLNLMKYYYQERELEKAIEQQELFQKMANDYDKKFSYMIESEIEGAYSAAAVYYYKNNQYKKAIEIVEKGLGYCPTNYRLKQRLDALK